MWCMYKRWFQVVHKLEFFVLACYLELSLEFLDIFYTFSHDQISLEYAKYVSL